MLSFATRDEIPEPIRGEFVEIGGKWVPDGYVPAATHEEMKRKANPDRLAELESKAKAWGDLDPAKAREALAEADKLRAAAEAKAAGVEPGKLDALVEQRAAKLRTDHEAAIRAEREAASKLQGELETATSRLNQLEIGGAVKAAAGKIKDFRPEALGDAEERALKVFRREEGKIIARDSEDAPLYINGKPATPETWLESLREEKGHWFKAPSGSGATGNESPGGSGKKITRAQFDGMNAAERMAFFKDGGNVQ